MRLFLKKIGGKALDFLLPPRCIACDESVEAIHLLCSTCWSGMDFLSDPQCARCGFPFEVDYGDDMVCAGCLHREPHFETARSVVAYTTKSKQMILRFKHGDATNLAPAFARMLIQAHGEALRECDVLVPVPIHTRRLWVRWYNQAGLMATHVGRLVGVSVDHFLLKRHKNTRPQGKMSAQARRDNVKGSISLGHPFPVGLHVGIIDDVLTTGATVNECARVLRAAGAKRVDIFTLARVVSNRSD